MTEEPLGVLIRPDQQDEHEFECGAYDPKER